MNKLRRSIVCLLAAALLLGPVRAAAAQTVTTAGRTLQLVAVPLDGTCAGHVVTAGGLVCDDRPAAELIRAAAAYGTVTAAVNGMFFNAYYNQSAPRAFPDNAPMLLTTLVQDGQVQAGSVVGTAKQNCIGFARDGRVLIDAAAIQVTVSLGARGEIPVWRVNGRESSANAVVLMTDAMPLPFAVPAGAYAVLIENGRVTARVTAASATLTAGQKLLMIGSGVIDFFSKRDRLPQAGDELTIRTTVTAAGGADWSRMNAVAAGGRMLIHQGRIVAADAAFNALLDKDPKQNATGVYQRSFAAVMKNGTLLLGTGTASFNEVAAFLAARGAVDAVSLDGGASGMLYEGGRFVTAAGRELASAIVFTKPAVRAVQCAALVDGAPVSFGAYSVGGNNYCRLRDFALVLRGSARAFGVGWDAARAAVSLTSGADYVPIGGELSAAAAPRTVKLNQSSVWLDGAQIDPLGYTIDGSNYFKLRDLCAALDVGIDWDAASQTVLIRTK